MAQLLGKLSEVVAFLGLFEGFTELLELKGVAVPAVDQLSHFLEGKLNMELPLVEEVSLESLDVLVDPNLTALAGVGDMENLEEGLLGITAEEWGEGDGAL